MTHINKEKESGTLCCTFFISTETAYSLMKKIKLVEIFCYLVFFLISKNRYVFVAFSVFILPLPVTFNLHGQKEILGGESLALNVK